MNGWMNKIKIWVENNLFQVISVPVILNFINFLAGLGAAMKDGMITHEEAANLMTGTNGFETILLAIALVIWGKK